MSFYNMLFGKNPNSALLLAVVGCRDVDVPRFRDVFYDGEEIITVHTRTGGGNREAYDEDNAALARLPGFVRDYDDDFDATYANFEYRVAEEWREDVRRLGSFFEHGLRADFAKHLAKTLMREPTEADKKRAAYEAERNALSRTDHFMANGHTFVPKSDWAMKEALEIAEKNGGDLQTAWGIMPLRLSVAQNHVEWPGAKDETLRKMIHRVKVGYSHKWEIDTEYWDHCVDLFSAEFPLTMGKIAEAVARKLEAAAQ